MGLGHIGKNYSHWGFSQKEGLLLKCCDVGTKERVVGKLTPITGLPIFGRLCFSLLVQATSWAATFRKPLGFPTNWVNTPGTLFKRPKRRGTFGFRHGFGETGKPPKKCLDRGPLFRA